MDFKRIQFHSAIADEFTYLRGFSLKFLAFLPKTSDIIQERYGLDSGFFA